VIAPSVETGQEAAGTVGPMSAPVDLLVVGAGPAGAAAAITATAHGLRVVVCDRARFPRDKTCGDGLTTAALRLLERLGVPAAALAAHFASVRDVVLVAPSGREVALALPGDGTYAGVITRTDLDTVLVEHAARRGAEIRVGAEVTDVVATADRVKVACADGTVVETRHVVAADGHWSAVRRALRPSAPRDLGTWHAARVYVDGVDDERLWVLFDADLLPGYAWVFPLAGGGANVGFGVLRGDRRGRDLRHLWADVIDRPRLRAVLGGAIARTPVRAWPIPTRYDPAALTDGPVLYAGDAAQVVDPMTGEGIAQALETGVLAVEAVVGGGDADAIAARYRRRVDRALGRDLRFAAALQRVLASPGAAELALRMVDVSPWTRRNFARWMFEGYPRALLATPDRWARAMFTAPGAYASTMSLPSTAC
jgi:geranylgeranyl reductase family protein